MISAAASEGDGDGLARLAQRGRRVLDVGTLASREAFQDGFVGVDVAGDDIELTGHVLDRPASGLGGEHRLSFFAQVVGIGAQFGQVGGVGLEMRAAGALVADRAGLAAGAHIGGLGALAHRHRHPREVLTQVGHR